MASNNRIRARMWLFRIACGIVLAGGAAWTLKTNDEHGIERSGKMLVAMALGLTYWQFRYEVEHHAAEHTAHDAAAQLLKRKAFVTPAQEVDVLNRVQSAVRTRLDADRAFILLNALAIAAIGELVSAFGGLAIELFS